MGAGHGKDSGDSPSEEFTEQEKGFLDQIFHQMAIRSPDDTISKETFLSFFELPGVLGERLFEVFDIKKTGVIDFEEFITGYHKVCHVHGYLDGHSNIYNESTLTFGGVIDETTIDTTQFAKGTASDKIEMLFNLFDLDSKGGITKEELSTVLMSIVTPPQQMFAGGEEVERTPSARSPGMKAMPSFEMGAKSGLGVITAASSEGSIRRDESMPFHEIDEDGDYGFADVQTEVNKMVEDSFEQCDLDRSGRLSFEQFKLFLETNPRLLESLEEMFVVMSWDLPTAVPKGGYTMETADAGSHRFTKVPPSLEMPPSTGSFRMGSSPLTPLGGPSGSMYRCCTKCKLRFVSKREYLTAPEVKSDSEEEWDYVIMAFAYDSSSKDSMFRYCPKCSSELVSDLSLRRDSGGGSSLALSFKTDLASKSMTEEHFEGAVKMTGGRWGRLHSRYIVVHGKFLYIYKNKDKEFPESVVFIQGYFGEVYRDRAMKGGEHVVKFSSPTGSSGKTVKMHLKTAEEAESWLVKLERAARTVDIKRFYEIKSKLGKGTFAQVFLAQEKSTKRDVAVKVVEKKLIDGKQKEYLRVELSIMKLVKHPGVISLESVFETRHNVYMVMPLYPGGDLFDFMKANRRDGLDEVEGRKLIWNVLQALRYLHSIGIVHRDLKPENLLLKKVDSPCDVVITDFGLSKFAAPHEAMKAACGTLTYVAPEVLSMKGYGKEVDVWSVGIIMYLVLRAKLPFHDSTKQKIIARIMRQKVQLTDAVWSAKSEASRELIKGLLQKHPENRITTQEALEEAEWFAPLREQIGKAEGGDVELQRELADVTTDSQLTGDAMKREQSIKMIRQLTRKRDAMRVELEGVDEED